MTVAAGSTRKLALSNPNCMNEGWHSCGRAPTDCAIRKGPRYTRDVPPTFIDRGLMRQRNLVRRASAAGVWLLLIVGALTFLLRWRANTSRD
jgi:hypothetical protein